MAYKIQQQKTSSAKRKRLYKAGTLIVVLLLLAVVAGVIYHRHSTPAVPATGPQTKGEVSAPTTKTPTKSSTNSPTQSASQDKSSSSDATQSTTSASLLDPTGNFVSNHHPNLSGQPAPNQITSACITTPGASCQITFTMGGVTKSLPSKTTDGEGSAYWVNWTLQSIGLTPGTWTVSAVATLHGNVKTATDGQGLVVAQ